MDMATKYLMVYFLRTHTHAEVRAAYLQFLADAAPFLNGGRVGNWFMDNGSEFNVSAGVGKDKPGFFANNTDTWLAEYFTRRRFIVPWNPQSNPAESVNRILLRPARAALLAAGRGVYKVLAVRDSPGLHSAQCAGHDQPHSYARDASDRQHGPSRRVRACKAHITIHDGAQAEVRRLAPPCSFLCLPLYAAEPVRPGHTAEGSAEND